MYKKDVLKTCLLYLAGGLAIGICVALIIFFVYTLQLRTEYRQTALEINEYVLAYQEKGSTVTWKGKTYPLSEACLDYYNRFLLDAKTVVAGRRSMEPTERSIILSFGGGKLTFTQAHEDGYSTNIRWETPDGVKNYEVASQTTFMQMAAYISNYTRRLEQE